MRRTVPALVLSAAAILIGCDHSGRASLGAPRVSVRSEAGGFAALGPSNERPNVSGSGHTVVAGELRTFTFTARQDADGTARGTAHVNNRSINEMFDLEIGCLKVVGSVAIMSGVITKHTDTHAIGLTGVLGVVDAGEGQHEPRDAVTQVFFFRPGTVTCQDFGPAEVAEFATPIASGNVEVH